MDEGTQSSGEILLAIDWQVSSFLSTCKLSIGRHLLCNTTQPYTNGSKINRCHIHMIAEVHAAPTTACTTTCFVPMVNPSRWGSARACMSSASFQRASLVVTKPDLVALSPHAALPSTFHAPLVLAPGLGPSLFGFAFHGERALLNFLGCDDDRQVLCLSMKPRWPSTCSCNSRFDVWKCRDMVTR